MTTEATITMVVVQGIVTVITAYFFFRVLTYKPKKGDSYIEEE